QAFHAVEYRLVQGHVDHLTAPARVAVLQSQQDADHAMQCGQRIADAYADSHRHAPRLAGQVAQAAHRFGHDTEARAIAIGSGLAIAADAQHDQAAIELEQAVGAEAPAFERSGTEVFNQHVGMAGEPAHDVLRVGILQVQGDRTFVARLDLPPHRGAVLEQAPLAQGIAAARSGPLRIGRRLDLDDISAEIGQRLGREGSRDQLPKFENLEPGQRPRRQLRRAHQAFFLTAAFFGADFLATALSKACTGDSWASKSSRFFTISVSIRSLKAPSKNPSRASSTKRSLVTLSSPFTPERVKLTRSEVLPSSYVHSMSNLSSAVSAHLNASLRASGRPSEWWRVMWISGNQVSCGECHELSLSSWWRSLLGKAAS